LGSTHPITAINENPMGNLSHRIGGRVEASAALKSIFPGFGSLMFSPAK